MSFQEVFVLFDGGTWPSNIQVKRGVRVVSLILRPSMAAGRARGLCCDLRNKTHFVNTRRGKSDCFQTEKHSQYFRMYQNTQAESHRKEALSRFTTWTSHGPWELLMTEYRLPTAIKWKVACSLAERMKNVRVCVYVRQIMVPISCWFHNKICEPYNFPCAWLWPSCSETAGSFMDTCVE